MNPISRRLIERGSPFELQDAVVEGVPCRIFPHGPQTLQDIFLRALSFPRLEFIVSEKRRLNFGQALNEADRFAEILHNWYGVGKNSRVGVLMDNTPEWAVAFISIYFAGASAVLLSAASEEQSLLNALEMSGCSLIITDRHNVNILEALYGKYHFVLFSDLMKPGKSLSGSGEKQPLSIFPIFEPMHKKEPRGTLPLKKSLKPEPDDDALISFTSGSTGIPKAVLLSHRNLTTGLMNMMLGGLLANARSPENKGKNRTGACSGRPCSLLLSPFSHISGYSQLMLMFYLGGKIVLMSEWNKRQAATLIEKEKIDSVSGLSTMIINEILHSKGSAHKLKNISIHGTALHDRFLRKMENKFPFINIRTGYGMTETSGSISSASGKELINKPGSSGPAIPSVEVRVIDRNGENQPTGKHGEIWVRGAMVMKRYCADPYKTGAVMNNGWLKTGDRGYLDSCGNLYITDRLKDTIMCGNNYISASGKSNRDEMKRRIFSKF